MDPCKIPKLSYGHKHRVIHFHFYTKKPRYPFLSFPPPPLPSLQYLENPVLEGQLAAICYQTSDRQTERGVVTGVLQPILPVVCLLMAVLEVLEDPNGLLLLKVAGGATATGRWTDCCWCW